MGRPLGGIDRAREVVHTHAPKRDEGTGERCKREGEHNGLHARVNRLREELRPLQAWMRAKVLLPIMRLNPHAKFSPQRAPP